MAELAIKKREREREIGRGNEVGNYLGNFVASSLCLISDEQNCRQIEFICKIIIKLSSKKVDKSGRGRDRGRERERGVNRFEVMAAFSTEEAGAAC